MGPRSKVSREQHAENSRRHHLGIHAVLAADGNAHDADVKRVRHRLQDALQLRRVKSGQLAQMGTITKPSPTDLTHHACAARVRCHRLQRSQPNGTLEFH